MVKNTCYYYSVFAFSVKKKTKQILSEYSKSIVKSTLKIIIIIHFLEKTTDYKDLKNS